MNTIVSENLKPFYAKVRDYESIILRFALLYGIGNPLFDCTLRKTAPSPTSGLGEPGEQRRPLVHLDDTVAATRRCCFEAGAKNETVNVAGPGLFTFRAVGPYTRSATGAATWDDMFPGTTRQRIRHVRQYDMGKAKTLIGFAPSVSIFDGLREPIEHAQQDGALPARVRPHARTRLLYGRERHAPAIHLQRSLALLALELDRSGRTVLRRRRDRRLPKRRLSAACWRSPSVKSERIGGIQHARSNSWHTVVT